MGSIRQGLGWPRAQIGGEVSSRISAQSVGAVIEGLLQGRSLRRFGNPYARHAYYDMATAEHVLVFAIPDLALEANTKQWLVQHIYDSFVDRPAKIWGTAGKWRKWSRPT